MHGSWGKDGNSHFFHPAFFYLCLFPHVWFAPDRVSIDSIYHEYAQAFAQAKYNLGLLIFHPEI